MLIFSTSLPVVDDFDRMKFIELGVIWNQKSPTDALKGKEWDGKATSFRWEDEDKSFEVLSLDDITAIKFIKNDSSLQLLSRLPIAPGQDLQGFEQSA